jgi:hypothetical protein
MSAGRWLEGTQIAVDGLAAGVVAVKLLDRGFCAWLDRAR